MDDNEARRTPESRGGRLYPMDSIIAHIGDAGQAADATTTSSPSQPASRSAVVASGDEVIQVSGAAQAGRRFPQRITAAFPSEEADSENEFKAAADRGT